LVCSHCQFPYFQIIKLDASTIRPAGRALKKDISK
jgi:hypothetical protein